MRRWILLSSIVMRLLFPITSRFSIFQFGILLRWISVVFVFIFSPIKFFLYWIFISMLPLFRFDLQNQLNCVIPVFKLTMMARFFIMFNSCILSRSTADVAWNSIALLLSIALVFGFPYHIDIYESAGLMMLSVTDVWLNCIIFFTSHIDPIICSDVRVRL